MIDETRYKETTVSTSPPTTTSRMPVEPGLGPTHEYEFDRAAADRSIKRTSWGAVWAGVLVAMGIQALLAVLGAAIGLSVLQAQEGNNLGESLGAGAAIWWTITGIISLFIGGWVVAYLLGPRPTFIGALHGFVMWCTVTAVSAFFLTSVGASVLSGGMNMLGSGMAAQQNQQQGQNPVQSGSQDLQQRMNDPQSQEQVKQSAEKTAGATWWTFIALLLGASAAVVGGCMTPDSHRKRHYDSGRSSGASSSNAY
jgi:hypothetical protein